MRSSKLPRLIDRINETLTESEKFESSWAKVKIKAELKIKQNTAEICGTNCDEIRTHNLRGAIMAYEDILTMDKE